MELRNFYENRPRQQQVSHAAVPSLRSIIAIATAACLSVPSNVSAEKHHYLQEFRDLKRTLDRDKASTGELTRSSCEKLVNLLLPIVDSFHASVRGGTVSDGTPIPPPDFSNSDVQADCYVLNRAEPYISECPRQFNFLQERGYASRQRCPTTTLNQEPLRGTSHATFNGMRIEYDPTKLELPLKNGHVDLRIDVSNSEKRSYIYIYAPGMKYIPADDADKSGAYAVYPAKDLSKHHGGFSVLESECKPGMPQAGNRDVYIVELTPSEDFKNPKTQLLLRFRPFSMSVKKASFSLDFGTFGVWR